jgi:predicted lipoprotein with Yx(FWY)xxD motif
MTLNGRIPIGASLVASLAALAIAGCGGNDNSAASGPATPASGKAAVDVADSSLGKILVDPQGRTLYMFEKDTGSKSTCFGACASAWPPFRTDGSAKAGAGASAAMVGTTSRSDGEPEVTYDGHPLYYYAGDQSPGDTNGEGLTQFGGGWYVVSPSGQPIEGNEAASAGGGSGY